MNSIQIRGKCVLFPVLASLIILTYFRAINGEFLFDDFPRIVENSGLQEPIRLKRAVTEGMPSRPFLMLSLALNKILGGDYPFGYHLLNTVIHALNSILVFVWLSLLCDLSRTKVPTPLPFAVSALFALHPLQTESVSYAICRGEGLSTFFYLMVLCCYLTAFLNKRPIYYLAAFLFALMGVATKETVATLPAIIFLTDYCFITGRDLRRSLKRAVCAMPFYLAVAAVAVHLVKMDAGVGLYERGIYSNLLTQINVVAYYIKMLFFPINQTFDYDFREFGSLWEQPTLLCLTLLTGLLAWALLNLKKSPIVSFFMLWFFITLSPTSSVIPIDDIIFEHRLYLPSVGFCVALAVALIFFSRKLTKPAWAALVIIAPLYLFSINTLNRNQVYENAISFWEDAVNKSPSKDRPNHNLGSLYGRIKEYEKAEKALKRALKISPWHLEARSNLGEIYFHQGRFDEAEAEFEKVIARERRMPSANYFLGRIYEKRGLPDKAVERYQEALKKEPGMLLAGDRLAAVFLEKGDYPRALKQFKKVLEYKPDDVEANANIGILYGRMGLYQKAVKHFEAALLVEPKNPTVMKNLALARKLLQDKGRSTKISTVLKKNR